MKKHVFAPKAHEINEKTVEIAKLGENAPKLQGMQGYRTDLVQIVSKTSGNIRDLVTIRAPYSFQLSKAFLGSWSGSRQDTLDDITSSWNITGAIC